MVKGVRDSGLLHALLSIASHEDLTSHPKLGGSWEGFALEQVLGLWNGAEAYYWRTHAGAELDLLLFRGGRRYGFEFKYADAPKMTKSLHAALADLKLEQAWIVYPGRVRYRVHERAEVVPLVEVADGLRELLGAKRSVRRRSKDPRGTRRVRRVPDRNATSRRDPGCPRDTRPRV